MAAHLLQSILNCQAGGQHVGFRLCRHVLRALTQAPVRPFSSNREHIVTGEHSPITGQLWAARQDAEPSGDLSKAITYPFSTDSKLREVYRNPWDRMRIGRVMEDCDSLAGSIAFGHCHKGGAAPLLVTASVDEVTLSHAISIHHDITLQGRVAWTGSSSLDILITLSQPQYTQPSLTALFSYVHLDPTTRKPSPVPQFEPHTADEQALFQARQHIADERKRARHAAATIPAPGASPEARAFMTPLLQRYHQFRELPALAQHGSADGRGAVLLPNTQLQNTFICQPQQRNTAGRIFGGFLIRRAYELAFASAYTFAGTRPTFLKCDEITFRKPVNIGDLLRFRSSVLHTAVLPAHKGLVCVEVEATVAKPEDCNIAITNTFSFVFQVDDHPVSGPVKQVLPTSEEEAVKAWQAHQGLLESGYLHGH